MSGRPVKLSGVEHWFDGPQGSSPHRILERTNIDVGAQEFVALVGPSGCGKTTVLNMVAGLITPSHGSVQVGGQAPRLGDPGIGYLLARDALLPWLTALQNVTLPLEIRGVRREERQQIARDVLRDVGLAEFTDAYPAQLSHGMRQRVAVARTLVPEPSTLLMDEPFSALDAQTRLRLQGQFLRLWERQKSTVVFVTHDLSEAIIMADRVLVFSARPGSIIAEFPVTLPRPRNVVDLQGSSEYHELFQKIWQIFKQEVA
ncbi:MAG: ABC transporter ATP-binding protein [Micromonosporaceae bacterium]